MAIFEFTESDAVIRFRREHNHVEVSCNYTPDEAQVAYTAIHVEATRFALAVCSDLVRIHPELGDNVSFQGLRNDILTLGVPSALKGA
jgi:hypothetical protein